MRFGSYPHNAFKKPLTVSTVGVEAVKNFSFTGGNGSAFVCCPRLCNCNGAPAFCAAGADCAAGAGFAAAPAPVWAPAATVTLRAATNPANIHCEIFKDTI